MPQYKDKISLAAGNGGRISPLKVRDLYNSFCENLIRMSRMIEVEAATFETRFTCPDGLHVTLVPYRDLFMVSVGSSPQCDIRVIDEEGWNTALDLALNHFLLIRSGVAGKNHAVE
ncbi:MAG: hypothetical protein KAV42_02625 [Candidatus Krumholzibacteria bacterium]|nr:hypothetical protein [Candidatus Krumholzibacteria bacterium]